MPLWEEAAGHRDRLLAWAQGMTRDAGEAEEAVQDTLLKAWLKGASVRCHGARWSWLYTVLLNSVRARGRSRRRWPPLLYRSEVLVAAAGGPDLIPPSPEAIVLIDGLLSLRPSYREILDGVCGEGQSLAEFAQRHGITRNNAKMRLRRARRALRQELEKPRNACVGS